MQVKVKVKAIFSFFFSFSLRTTQFIAIDNMLAFLESICSINQR